MKKLFEIGNRYAAESDWKDFSLTKLCLCAMGILIGIHIPAKGKKATSVIAGSIFCVTYVLLIKKLVKIVKNMIGGNI